MEGKTRNLVLLDYSFVFDPGETWGMMAEFDRDLAEFLEGKGLLANTIKPMESTGRKIIFVSKKPAPMPTPSGNFPRKMNVPTPKQMAKELTNG